MSNFNLWQQYQLNLKENHSHIKDVHNGCFLDQYNLTYVDLRAYLTSSDIIEKLHN